jgi:tripartite-type tricarboxylate transporter receptor subunit TctC
MNGWMKGLVAAATCAAASATFAQDVYPSKPVHLLVPFPPGGAVDVVARSLGDEFAKRLGQSIIIENRPGAGGTLAAMATAKSAPDGYTLVVVASGHAIVPFLFPRLQYDVFNDFTPISLLGNSPNLLLVKADSPMKTLADLIALARQKPGQLSYGHAGNGTSPHLAGELLKVTAKIDITAVPYKGGAPALNDLMGGHIPIAFNNLPEAIGQIQAGTVRALAVTTIKRTPMLPDVPTVAESGLTEYDTGVWWGVLAPAGLPVDIQARLSRDCAEAMKSPAVTERFRTLGATPIGGSAAEFAKLIRADYDKWGPVIKAAGIQGE